MTKEKCLNEINEHIYNKLIYSWLCDQLEEELLTLLQRCRGILQAALEALNQYRVITSQFLLSTWNNVVVISGNIV